MAETALVIVIVEQVWRETVTTDRAGLRLVVPLDGGETSRQALVPALALARRTGARLELVTTRVPDSGPATPESFLTEIAAGLDGVISSSAVRRERDPVDAIEAVVAEGEGPALIVMTTHGRARAARAALGSTAEAVVVGGSAPVLMVGPEFDADEFDPGGLVLVAHDGDQPPDVDLIAGLAKTANGRVVLLEVAFSATGSALHRRPSPAVSEAGAAVAHALRERGVEVTAEGRYGANRHRVIVDEAVELGASYVVVTTRARTGAARVAFGSVAAGVVGASPVPVLVARSD